jgi:hypothetical protein
LGGSPCDPHCTAEVVSVPISDETIQNEAFSSQNVEFCEVLCENQLGRFDKFIIYNFPGLFKISLILLFIIFIWKMKVAQSVDAGRQTEWQEWFQIWIKTPSVHPIAEPITESLQDVPPVRSRPTERTIHLSRTSIDYHPTHQWNPTEKLASQWYNPWASCPWKPLLNGLRNQPRLIGTSCAVSCVEMDKAGYCAIAIYHHSNSNYANIIFEWSGKFRLESPFEYPFNFNFHYCRRISSF